MKQLFPLPYNVEEKRVEVLLLLYLFAGLLTEVIFLLVNSLLLFVAITRHA